MMGRTHSVHAEPTTLGMKIAGWAFEIARDRARLTAAVDDAATGKISGPVGTYSHLDPDLEDEVLADLGLHRDPISTQIVQRDRHAALLAAIAVTGGSLERIATEVRNLQHTEIGELMEPFRAGQKGSSAMPHKRNPILCERIAGMARLLRGYAGAALENQPLWHERDISHSSAERVLLPDATILLDYMLVKTRGLVERLVVRPERMRENIERGLGLHCSSRVLLALVDQAGMSREDAYAVVQRSSLQGRRRAPPAARPAGRRSGRRRSPLRRGTGGLLRREPLPAQRRPPPWPDWTICFRPPPQEGGRRCPLNQRTPAIREPRGHTLDGRRAASCVRARCATCSISDDRLLLVASDRLSAFDVVLPTPIPDKGRVLTGLSRFWFAQTADLIPNHLLGTDPASLPLGFTDDAGSRRAAGPDDDLPPGQRVAGGDHRPRLPGRLGLEGVSEDRLDLRHQAAGGAA